MNKKILFVIGTTLIFSACTKTKTPKTVQDLNQNNNAVQASASPTQKAANPTSNPSSTPQTYSLTDISNHNTKNDCWFIIDNSVYDVSNFISNHPGGIIIAQGCGKDASKLFHAVGNHQGKTAEILKTLKVGNLN